MRIRLSILLVLAAGLGLPPQVPAPLRFAGMSLLLWALPGWGFRRVALAGEPASLLDQAAFTALTPWAMHGIVGSLVAPLGVSPVALTASLAAVGITLAFVPGLDRRPPDTARADARGVGFDRFVVVVAALLALVLWIGPPLLGLGTDIYAHVAAVKACLQEGRIFPIHEFYPPAQGTGADPRFGVGHAYYAAWAALARMTPMQAWHGTAALAVVGMVLGVGSLVRATCESPLSRGLGWLVFLAAYGGSFYNPLRVAPYPLWLGLGLLWLALARVLRDSRDASWRTALGAALLVVGSGGMHALAFLLGCGMLLVGWLVSRGRRRRWWTKTLWFTVIAGLPVMGARFAISYGNVNPIHQRPWENMEWVPGWLSVSPTFLIDWLWPLGFVGLLLVPSLLRQAKDRENVRWSTTLSLVSIVWLITPLLLTPSMKLLGFLPMRLVMTILFPILIGQWIDGRGLGPLRASSLLGGALVAVLSVLLLGQRVTGLWAEDRDVLVKTPQWTGLIEHLNEAVDPEAVILSDPFTMMALRAMAPQSIVAVPDGRSSPRDAQSIERLRASWRAMSASVGGSETDEILRRYAVTHVVVDHLFERTEISYEYPVVPASFPAQAVKFLQNPARFEVVWESDGLVLLRVNDGGVWDESYLTPCVAPRQEAQASVVLVDGFVLLDPQVETVADDTWRLTGNLSWEGSGSPPFRYFVIRADRVPSPVPTSLRVIEKPARKVDERLHHTLYRQRWTKHIACPTYLLRPDTQMSLAFDLPIPSKLEAGDYEITLQVSDFTSFTVLRPRDFIRDDDAYSGPPLATMSWPAGGASR